MFIEHWKSQVKFIRMYKEYIYHHMMMTKGPTNSVQSFNTGGKELLFRGFILNIYSQVKFLCMYKEYIHCTSFYNGHSFWIGAATTAVQRGLEDSLIQTLGSWHSDAYKLYIKLPGASWQAPLFMGQLEIVEYVYTVLRFTSITQQFWELALEEEEEEEEVQQGSTRLLERKMEQIFEKKLSKTGTH